MSSSRNLYVNWRFVHMCHWHVIAYPSCTHNKTEMPYNCLAGVGIMHERGVYVCHRMNERSHSEHRAHIAHRNG